MGKCSQPTIKDQVKRAQVQAKLEKVLARRYMLTTGLTIKSLMKYFAVDKGTSDIRMVYDGTANGLNECCWVPTFWLATIDSLLRSLDANSWMTDRDLADMFLNYQPHQLCAPSRALILPQRMSQEKERRKRNQRPSVVGRIGTEI